MFWILVLGSLNVVWLLNTRKEYAQSDFCNFDVKSREIVNMIFVSQVSGLVENFNIGNFSHTINVINVKLCLMVLPTELCLFIPLSVTMTMFQGHSNVEQF